MSQGMQSATCDASSPPARRAPEPHEHLLSNLSKLPPEPPFLPPRVLGVQSRGDVVSCRLLTVRKRPCEKDTMLYYLID